MEIKEETQRINSSGGKFNYSSQKNAWPSGVGRDLVLEGRGTQYLSMTAGVTLEVNRSCGREKIPGHRLGEAIL